MSQAKLYVRNYTSGSNVPGYHGDENATYRVNADSFTTQSGEGSLATTWTVQVTGIDELTVHAGSLNHLGQGQIYWWPGTKFLRGTSSHPLHQDNGGSVSMEPDVYYAETDANASITVFVQHGGYNYMQIRNITTAIASLTPPNEVPGGSMDGFSEGVFTVVLEVSASKLYVRNYTSGSNVPGYHGDENATYRVNADSFTTQSGEGSLATTWTVEVTDIDELMVHAGSLNHLGQGQIYWWPGTKFLRGISSHPLHQDNGGSINMHPDMYYAETDASASITVFVQHGGYNYMQIRNITTAIASLTPPNEVPGGSMDGFSEGVFAVVLEVSASKLYVRNYTSGSNVPGYHGDENATYRVNADSVTTLSGEGSLETTWTVEVTDIDELMVHAGSLNYLGHGQMYNWPQTKFLRGTSSHPLHQDNGGSVNMHPDMYYAETDADASITVFVQHGGYNYMQIRNITTEIASLTPPNEVSGGSMDGFSEGIFTVVQGSALGDPFIIPLL